MEEMRPRTLWGLPTEPLRSVGVHSQDRTRVFPSPGSILGTVACPDLQGAQCLEFFSLTFGVTLGRWA